jgi:hypothetical protein
MTVLVTTASWFLIEKPIILFKTDAWARALPIYPSRNRSIEAIMLFDCALANSTELPPAGANR